ISILPMFIGRTIWRRGIEGGNALARFRNHPDPSHDVIPPMPDAVADLLEACFQQNPDDRPANMDVVADTLRTIYAEEVGAPYPRSKPVAGRISAESLNNRAVSLLDLGRRNEAERLWEKALRTHPNHPESTFNLHLLRWRDGQEADDLRQVGVMKEAARSQEHHWIPSYLLSLLHMERGDADSAIQVVKKSIDRFGDEEEDLLDALATSRFLLRRSRRLLGAFGDEGKIQANIVDLSADGVYGISGNNSGKIRLWNLRKRMRAALFDAHEGPITAICLTTTGNLAVTGSEDTTAKLWDLSDQSCITVFRGHVKPVLAVQIDPEAGRIYSGSADQTIKVWDMTTGRCLQTLLSEHGPVNALKLHPNRTQLVSAGGAPFAGDYAIRIRDIADGTIRTIMEGHQKPVTSLALDADGCTLMSGSEDATVRVWETHTGDPVRTLDGHDGPVNGVALTHSPDHALSVCGDRFARENSLRLWNLNTGRCLRTFTGHDEPVRSVAVSANGRFALTAGDDGRLFWWLVQADAFDWRAPMALCRVLASETVSTAQANYERHIHIAHKHLEEGDTAKALHHVVRAREQSGFSRGREAMALLEMLSLRLPRGGFIGGWEIGDWTDDHNHPVHAVSITRKEGRIVTGDAAGIVIIRTSEHSDKPHRFSSPLANIRTLVELTTPSQPDSGQTSDTPAHSLLFATANEGRSSIGIWQTEEPRPRKLLSGHTRNILDAAIMGGGKLVVSAGAEGVLRSWETASGKCLRIHRGHMGQVFAVVPHPDGRRFLSAGEDGTIRLWSLSRTRPLQVWTGHEGQALSIDCSRDGRFIVSGGSGGHILVRRISDGVVLRTLRGHTDFV
ncbi:MAG: hypothetical protein HQL50_15685, partial [Magnetococcales bacterium]|nr:hypothetical protein [Magnetococcales bacterium]